MKIKREKGRVGVLKLMHFDASRYAHIAALKIKLNYTEKKGENENSN